jgi:hypothetical protein
VGTHLKPGDQLSGFIFGIEAWVRFGCLEAGHTDSLFCITCYNFFFLSILFFARPKESIQKKRRPASRFSLRVSKFSLPCKENLDARRRGHDREQIPGF